jgi:hypothetical protein
MLCVLKLFLFSQVDIEGAELECIPQWIEVSVKKGVNKHQLLSSELHLEEIFHEG